MKINILFTDLSYLYCNYGSQAVALPLIEKLNEHFEMQSTFALTWIFNEKNEFMAKKLNSNIVAVPHPLVMMGELVPLIKPIYKIFALMKKKQKTLKREEEKLVAFIKKLKECDVVINLAGIEFVENPNPKKKWLNYINTVCPQYLAGRYKKLYLKNTKSYGPLNTVFYRFLVKRQLNKLPFVFVRIGENFNIIKKLGLKTTIYAVPDISIALEPASREWAVNYLEKIGLDISKPIIGLSPSSVIVDECATVGGDKHTGGLKHVELCEKLIDFFQKDKKQIVILPHSIFNGKDSRVCDLGLSKKIYEKLENKDGVYLISDMNLDYKQTKAMIGLFNFYIAGRYHAVSSALSMGVPVISLSWHMKYRDIMSLFLDDYLVIDCGKNSVENAMIMIKKYYQDQKWFNKKIVLEKKEVIVNEIENKIIILMSEIEKSIAKKYLINITKKNDQ